MVVVTIYLTKNLEVIIYNVQYFYYNRVRRNLYLMAELQRRPHEMVNEFNRREPGVAGNPIEPVIIDPYYGEVRRRRILDNEEDARSDESYFERRNNSESYVKRVKGAHGHEGGESEEPEGDDEGTGMYPEWYKPVYLPNEYCSNWQSNL